MKHPCLIALVLLLVWVACTPSGKVVEPVETPSAELASIDSLMWIQPDSALVRLLDYFQVYTDGVYTVSTADTYNRHYAHLLLSELLYKNDSSQTNRAELRQAVAYFDSLMVDTRRAYAQNRAFLDARAHYINGVGFYEKDSVVQACSEYMKALEVMEESFEIKELTGYKAKFIALTYTHLTGLFSNFYLHDQAIYFGKKSLDYYKKYEALPRHVAWILNKIGSQYEMKKVFDTACCYYQLGINTLLDTNNLTYRDLATRLAFCSYQKGGMSSFSLNQLHNLLEQSESEKERLSRCLSIGGMFFHEKLFDSAKFYLSDVYERENNIESKKQAAEWLVEICEVEGSPSEAHEYARFLVPFATANETQGALKSQLATLCSQFEQSRQKTLHQKREKKLLEWGKLVLTIVAIFVSISVVSFFVNKKRRGRIEALKEETEEKLRTTINKHIKELEEKDIALNRAIIEERQKAETSLKEKEIQHSAVLGKAKNTIEHLQEINKMLNERKSKGDTETEQPKALKEEYDALMREGICVNIKQRLKKAEVYTSFDAKDYSSIALSSKELSELIQVIDKHCPDFSRRLKKQYPELNSNDIQLCRLYLLNLKVLQVAILLGTDYSSVRKRTNRLKGKIGSEELHLQLKSTLFEVD